MTNHNCNDLDFQVLMERQQQLVDIMLKQLLQKGSTDIPNMLLDSYRDLGISDVELVILLHLLRGYSEQEKNDLFLLEYLEKKMRLTRDELHFMLLRLKRRGIILMDKDPGYIKANDISFRHLFEKMIDWEANRDYYQNLGKTYVNEELIHSFQEYFNYLSSIEYSKIREWLSDDWTSDVILEALRITALARAKSFNFIQRVLDNWRINGVRTLDDARKLNQKFQDKKDEIIRESIQEDIEQIPRPAEPVAQQHQSLSKSKRRKAKSRVDVVVSSADGLKRAETEDERKKRFANISE